MRNPCRSLILIVVAACLAALPVSATTLLELSDEDMAFQADLIVQGRITGVESARVDGHLMTRVSVASEDVLKGGGDRVVTVLVPGGIDTSLKHPVATVYPGAPQFIEGQDVILFLNQLGTADGSSFAVVGFSQGAFSIVAGPAGQPVVNRDLSAVRLRHGGEETAGSSRVQSLEGFKASIRGYLNGTESN